MRRYNSVSDVTEATEMVDTGCKLISSIVTLLLCKLYYAKDIADGVF